MSYEAYMGQKATTVYMLRDLKIHSKFTLNEDSELLHVGLQIEGTSTYALTSFISNMSSIQFIMLSFYFN